MSIARFVPTGIGNEFGGLRQRVRQQAKRPIGNPEVGVDLSRRRSAGNGSRDWSAVAGN